MESYITYLIGFASALVCVRLWNYFYSYGIITLSVRTAINDCLIILTKNIQSVYDINELKYLALEMTDKDERFIEFQKNLDRRELSSMKNTVIRNFINCVPTRYNHLVPFDDWITAVEYINREANKIKKESE